MTEDKDPLLVEKEELYTQDLWLYVGTHGPDLELYKKHIYSFDLKDSLCGMRSKFFSVKKSAVLGVTETYVNTKQETTPSGSTDISFVSTPIPKDRFCKRCLNIVKSKLPVTENILSVPSPSLDKELGVPRLVTDKYGRTGEIVYTLPSPSVKTKLTLVEAKEMDSTWDWAKYYFPNISERHGKWIVLNKLKSYPINLENTMTELYDVYLTSLECGVPVPKDAKSRSNIKIK